MFLEATPSGKLARTYRKALAKSDPFLKDNCNQNKCKVCKPNSRANCKGRGVVYQMKREELTGRNVNDGLYIGRGGAMNFPTGG